MGIGVALPEVLLARLGEASIRRLAERRKAFSLRVPIDLTPHSFAFHLPDGQPNGFGGYFELKRYRSKGEAVVPA